MDYYEIIVRKKGKKSRPDWQQTYRLIPKNGTFKIRVWKSTKKLSDPLLPLIRQITKE
jgi:hypothetical protein